MFKKALITLAVVLVIFSAVVAMQPNEFKLSRSTSIAAAPAKIFAVVNNIHRWNDWSPWAKSDPSAKYIFEGPEKGVGAAQSWSGPKTGEGKMTLSLSQPSKKIEFQLEFYKPFKGSNLIEFTFQPEGKSTQVTWAMSGKNNFIAKTMNLLVGMEKMLGPMFDQGLLNLKTMVESKN